MFKPLVFMNYNKYFCLRKHLKFSYFYYIRLIFYFVIVDGDSRSIIFSDTLQFKRFSIFFSLVKILNTVLDNL